jgi:hypothetical protein
MREIMICAAYLRGVELEDLEQRHEPPLLTIVPVNDDGEDITDLSNSQKVNLGYNFYISFPKELMIIDASSHVASLEDETRLILRRQGIDIVADQAAIEAALAAGIEHTFCVWLKPDETTYREHCLFLPIRLFVPQETTGFDGMPRLDGNFIERLDELLGENSTESIKTRSQALILDLWQRWVKHFWSGQNSEDGDGLPVLRFVGHGIRWNASVVDTPCACDKDPSYCHTAEPADWPQPAVVYDHHGELDHHVHRENRLQSQVLFWEPHHTIQPQCQLCAYPPDETSSQEVLKHQLLEAALTRLAILDERVQSAVEEVQQEKVGKEAANRVRSLPISTIFQDMRVFIPPKHPCNLDRPKFAQISEWLCEARKQCGGFDFLVVHQGVLDKLQGSPETLVKTLAKVSGSAHVVVCSGRGIPSELPESARFVPLSSLLKWTVRDRSKYHLCQLLFSSRRPSHAERRLRGLQQPE